MTDLPSLIGYKLQTRHGFFDFEKPSNIDLRYVEHSLRNKVRFNGHAINPFTVLQHTVLVHDIAAMNHQESASSRELTQIRLACLLHDAPEYVVGDMASPLKAYIKRVYKFDINEIENEILAVIYRELGLPFTEYLNVEKYVKEADLIALAIEKKFDFDISDDVYDEEGNEYLWFNMPEHVGEDMFTDAFESRINEPGEYVNLVLKLAARLRAW